MRSKSYRDSTVAAHISNTIAAQLSAMREARGWTQTALADKAGMKQSRISALEDPNFENVEIATLRRLASAFDVALTVKFIPFSELARWTTEMKEPDLAVPEFSHDALAYQRATIVVPGLLLNFLAAPPSDKVFGLDFTVLPGIKDNARTPIMPSATAFKVPYYLSPMRH